MFCSVHFVRKREDIIPARLNIAETMETGDIKNHGMTGAWRMFCEESLGKFNAEDLELFRNRLVHMNSITWKCWLLNGTSEYLESLEKEEC